MRFYSLIILVLIFNTSKGQQVNYETAITEVVNKFNQIDKNEEYPIVLRQFVDLTVAYPKEWLPYYYAALLQTKMCLLKKGDADHIADEALVWINKCKRVQVNDEVLCAESLAYTAKMSVHPNWRWLSYQELIKTPLQQAKKINPNNPRIYVLQANLAYHLPRVLGGGCANALPIAKQAERLLNSEHGKAKYLPSWGHNSIKEILNTCKF